MAEWKIVFTKQAGIDARKLAVAGLKSKAEKLLKIIKKNPTKARNSRPRFLSPKIIKGFRHGSVSVPKKSGLLRDKMVRDDSAVQGKEVDYVL